MSMENPMTQPEAEGEALLNSVLQLCDEAVAVALDDAPHKITRSNLKGLALKIRAMIVVDRIAVPSVASVSRQLAEARAVVKEPHLWQQGSGPIALPDGEGGWIEIDNGAEYSDSLMCERTEKVLAGLPPDEAGPMPRGGVDAYWWQVAILERRKNKQLAKDVAEAGAERERVETQIRELYEIALRKGDDAAIGLSHALDILSPSREGEPAAAMRTP